MSSQIPHVELHSAADSFTTEPNIELEKVQMPKTSRRALRVFGLLLSVVLPGLSLHYDPYQFDVICDAREKTCSVFEHRLAQTLTTQIAFDEIQVVQAHTEWLEDKNYGTREPTGRYSLTFEMNDGQSIQASLKAVPEVLNAEALRKYIQNSAPKNNPFTNTTTIPEPYLLSTSTTFSDYIGVLGFFFLGLFLLALSLWRIEVAFDPTTKILKVTRQRWPLLSRIVVCTSIDNIKSARTILGEIRSVKIKMHDGREIHVARMLSSHSADAVTQAIDRKLSQK